MTGAPRIPGFARVRVRGGTFRFVPILREGDQRCTGMRVTREGETWQKETREAVTEELVVFAPSDIVDRLVLNCHYGLLEKETTS